MSMRVNESSNEFIVERESLQLFCRPDGLKALSVMGIKALDCVVEVDVNDERCWIILVELGFHKPSEILAKLNGTLCMPIPTYREKNH